MKDMEDNYLWDRSGEPDPEVQELEEILGTLRYQPRPLEIPQDIRVNRQRSFYPVMAIAAGIALLAVLLGLWVSFNQRQAPAPIQAKQDDQNKVVPAQVTNDAVVRPGPVAVSSPRPQETAKRESPRNLLARNRSRATRTPVRQTELTVEELAEKQQVLVALRLVSAKLNVAQRKAQGEPQLKVIRNQHKIG
jgi:hypothetical protein